MSCIFCKIISKEIPSTIVFESEKTLAILDIHPLRDGHTVVLPKLHKELVKDLPSDFAQDLGLTISKVSDILHASLNTDSNTIGINDGSGAGQGVPHVHAHIIPRKVSDGGGNLHSVMQSSTSLSLEEVAKRIGAIKK